jgi:hypothetical protein
MNEQSSESSATITKISFSQIKNDPKHRRVAGAVDEFRESIKLKHNATGRLVYNEEYGFYIDEENGIYIEDGEKHSYTFRIERPETGEKIENIVFTPDGNGGYKTMLVRYDIDKEEFYALTEAEIKEREIQISEYGREPWFLELLCIPVWKFSDAPPDRGWNTGGSVQHEIGWYIDYHCEWINNGGPGHGTGGNSGPGSGPGGPACCGGGSSGSGVLVLTAPIVEKYHKKNCEKLKKMVDTPGLTDKLQDLKTKVHDEGEHGYGVQKNPDGTYDGNATPIQSTPQNPNVINGKQVLGGHYIGIFHTHPDPFIGYFPMFSADDVLFLKNQAQQHDNYGQEKNYSDYFMVLTTVHGTYALKINDYQKLKNALTTQKFKEINDALFRQYSKYQPEDDPELMMKELLKIFQKFDMGVSLFEAEESTDVSGQPVYNWKGVSLNNSPILSQTLMYQPCN